MNESPISHRFGRCELRIWPEAQYVETIFPDEKVAGATRDSSEMGNLSYARHLGYPDCWTALVTHEAAHTLISEKLGHFFSLTLYAVAADYAPGTIPYEEQLYEEALVLAVERFANTGEQLPILLHPSVRPYFMRWAAELKALSARLLSQLPEAA